MRILLILGILFCCSANAQDKEKEKNKKPPVEEYIIKKDSSKIMGNVSMKENKIILDDKEYDLGELLGYKEGNHYHAIFGNSIYWVWALGKIQAYSFWKITDKYVKSDLTTGENGVKGYRTEFVEHRSSMCYLRKDSGNMVYYTSKNLLDLIKDNDDAVKEFNLYFKKINDNLPVDMMYGKLKKVLAVYNGNEAKNY